MQEMIHFLMCIVFEYVSVRVSVIVNGCVFKLTPKFPKIMVI